MGAESYANARTFASDGVMLPAGAWAYTLESHGNPPESASLQSWRTGLGLCNRSESCAPPRRAAHAGVDDWLLFVLNAPTDVASIRIDPYSTWNRDVSSWMGNISNSISVDGVRYSSSLPTDLANPGFGPGEDRTNRSLRGHFEDRGQRPRHSVPEPSSLLLLGAGIVLFRKTYLSRRKG